MTEYFAVMTLQGIQNGSLRTICLTTTPTSDTAATRAQIWQLMKDGVPDDARDLPVVFFSVEPNVLPTQRPVGTECLTAHRQGGDIR